MTSTGFNGNQLEFSLSFEYPKHVSTGSKPDVLYIEIVDPDFFSSTENSSRIPAGYMLKFTLPKMLESQFLGAIDIENAQRGVEIGI